MIFFNFPSYQCIKCLELLNGTYNQKGEIRDFTKDTVIFKHLMINDCSEYTKIFEIPVYKFLVSDFNET